MNMEPKKRIFVFSGKTERKYALVDAEMYPLLNLHKWRLNSDGYAFTYIGGKRVFMHEFVCIKTASMVVDHLNFNKLDNRKANLKAVTNNQNLLRNKNRLRKDLGVSFHHASDKWRARVSTYDSKGKKGEIYLGTFSRKKDAIIARNNYLRGIKNGT